MAIEGGMYSSSRESWPKRFGNSYANIERVARGEPPLWVVPELRGG